MFIGLILQDEMSLGDIYALAEHKLEATRVKLRARTHRMREYGDAKFLQKWLVESVRGLTQDQDA